MQENSNYEYPKTKWIAQLAGEFPMLPGETVGEKVQEIGFRPEWVHVGKGNLTCYVESVEALGESRYLLCNYKGSVLIILLQEYYDVG